VRASLTLDDFYTLLALAQRCAAFALKSGDPSQSQTGLNALSLIDWSESIGAT
jgi:hypothetical protein